MNIKDLLYKFYNNGDFPIIIDYFADSNYYDDYHATGIQFNPDMGIRNVFVNGYVFSKYGNDSGYELCDYNYPEYLKREYSEDINENVSYAKKIFAKDYTPGDTVPFDKSCDDDYLDNPDYPAWIVGIIITFNADERVKTMVL